MDVRYHLDPDTGLPHIFGHGVTEEEVEQVLRGTGEDLQSAGGSRMKLGQTGAGRYLQVIDVPDADFEGILVSTAYELQGREGVSASATEEATMKEPRFPPGWDEDRVREVLAHYENQTEDEQFAEIEAAREAEGMTQMSIPTELVPEVRALRSRHRNA